MNQETNVQEKEARVRQPWTAQRVGDILLNNALLIIMAIAVVYIAIKNPNFIKPASLINILSQTAAYLPAALGIGGCIVLTGTDLSAGRAVGITACISASLLQNAANMANKMWPQIGTLPIPVVIVLAMLIGAAIGLGAGLMSGYVGVGGGFIMVPLMLSLIHIPMKLASGTSLIAILILAIPGTIENGIAGNIDYVVGLSVAIGSIPGAVLGAMLVKRVPERVLRFIFGGFLIIAAIVLFLNEFGILG